ncbi:MAG: hypothetical protein QF902_09710 [Rhodospirillales bacterium]|nr:hypothetical protein [Rhodospirillales bacterium]
MSIRIAAAAMLVAGVLWWAPAGAEASYEEPAPYEVENKIVIEQARSVVWDRLIRNLRSDTFREVKENDGYDIIEVKFESTDPGNLIDCGRTKRSFAGDNSQRHFEYATADSTNYLTQGSKGDSYNVARLSSLDGRAVVTVKEAQQRTTVTVRVLFSWRIFLEYSDLDGRVSGGNGIIFHFTTDDPLANDGAGTPACVSRGLIENRILYHAR